MTDDDVKRLVAEVRAYARDMEGIEDPADVADVVAICDALDAAQQRVRELERERDDLLARAEAGCAYASECSFCAELQHEARTGGEE